MERINILVFDVVVAIFIVLVLLMTSSCVRCSINYNLNNEGQINNQILGLSVSAHQGIVGKEKDKLLISINQCNYYGSDSCGNAKIKDDSISLQPFSEIISDTLFYADKKEDVYIFESKHDNSWINSDYLKLKLSYIVDSLGSTYNKTVIVTLTRDKWCRFSIH